MNIKELIKDNLVKFDSYRQGNFYYKIIKSEQTALQGENITYLFTVPIDDIGTATLLSEDKAITFMRWIRKAINENTLVPVKKF
ncbi:MAG TPA: hypothetical protein VFD46_05220 [Chryseolinea sp.]|nr:hypothetical protein [Chryseolinea sp.]